MRRRTWMILAGFLLANGPMVAFGFQEEAHDTPAATESHASDAGQARDAHGGQGGQGDFKPTLLTFDPGVAIWSIIVFLALLIVLRAVAWKPILKVLQDREQFIQSSLDDAKREREEADKLLAQYKQQVDHACEEAAAVVEQGRRNAEEVGRRLQDEARREAAEMLERARREISLATDAAIKELYDRTADLAVDVAAGIIRKELSAQGHRELVNESLERMRAEGTKMN